MSIETKDTNDQPSTIHINNSHPITHLTNNDENPLTSFYSVNSDNIDSPSQLFVSFDNSNISLNESSDQTLIPSESTPRKFDQPANAQPTDNQASKIEAILSPIDKERAPDTTEGDFSEAGLSGSGSTTWNTCLEGTTDLGGFESRPNLSTDQFLTPIKLTSDVSSFQYDQQLLYQSTYQSPETAVSQSEALQENLSKISTKDFAKTSHVINSFINSPGDVINSGSDVINCVTNSRSDLINSVTNSGSDVINCVTNSESDVSNCGTPTRSDVIDVRGDDAIDGDVIKCFDLEKDRREKSSSVEQPPNSLLSTLSCELETELEAILNRSPPLTVSAEPESDKDDCLVDDRSLLRVHELRKRFESLDLFSEGRVKGVRSYSELTSSKLNLYTSESLDSNPSNGELLEIIPGNLPFNSISSENSSQYNTLTLKTPLTEEQTEIRQALLADFDSIFGDLTSVSADRPISEALFECDEMSDQILNEEVAVLNHSRMESDDIVKHSARTSETHDIREVTGEAMSTGDHDQGAEELASSGLFDLSKLPETIHVLEGESGAKVYLVGTAHFSKESQEDVRKIIRSTSPRDVVVELCPARKDIMLREDLEIRLSTPNPLSYQNVRLSIQKHGSTMVGLLNSLLLFVSLKIQQKTGLTPGGEFRAAFEECQLVSPRPSSVHLGDRNVFVTLQRAWYSLSAWKRLHLLYTLCTCDVDDITLEDVENCKGKDMLEQLLAELEQDFPELSRVIVSERDLYLASSIRRVADTRNAEDSVVAVVGIGHMKGIEENWERANTIDIAQLCVIPRRERSGLPWLKIVKFGILSGTLYMTYRYFSK